MTERNRRNRLRPPLMFAFRDAHRSKDARTPVDLRDENGERLIAGRRAAPRAAITEQRLRSEIGTDLAALVNTINFGSDNDLSPYEHIRGSILNYGFPDIANRTIDEHRVAAIRDELEEMLLRYEPRLARGSIAVEQDETLDKAELKIRFLVRAEVDCEPVNLPVTFVADIELDSGKIKLRSG